MAGTKINFFGKVGKFLKSKKTIAIILILAIVASFFAFRIFGKKDVKKGEMQTVQ